MDAGRRTCSGYTPPQHGDKHLGLLHSPGFRVMNGHGRSRIIDVAVFTGAMVLAHHQVDSALVLPVPSTELGIFVAGRVRGPIFPPQELQGDPFMAEFLMHLRPIRFRPRARPTSIPRVESVMEDRVRWVIRQGPCQAGPFKAFHDVAGGRMANALGPRNFAIFEAHLIVEP